MGRLFGYFAGLPWAANEQMNQSYRFLASDSTTWSGDEPSFGSTVAGSLR
jgi:hypothetical protein